MYVEIKHTLPWTDFTLIMPGISIGNVGQLAIDLLISTLQPRKVGYFYDAALWPIVGNDPYSEPGNTKGAMITSCEVYDMQEHRVVLVQQRVPLIKYRRYDFRRKLMAWIRKHRFGKVVLLSSSNTNSRINAELDGPSPLRYLCTPTVEDEIQNLLNKKLHWKKLERRMSLHSPVGQELADINGCVPTQVYIPGGGLTKKIFLECNKDEVSLVLLMLFCAEGDNIPDSLAMVSYLNEWLKIVKIKDIGDGREAFRWKVWKIPPSWKLLFAQKAPMKIYW